MESLIGKLKTTSSAAAVTEAAVETTHSQAVAVASSFSSNADKKSRRKGLPQSTIPRYVDRCAVHGFGSFMYMYTKLRKCELRWMLVYWGDPFQ